jgi:hypothetical protein
MIVFYLPGAEGDSSMRAAIHSSADLTCLIAPEDYFLSQTGNIYGMISNFA